MAGSTPRWEALQGVIAGEVVLPGSPAYGKLPKPVNARFHDVRPGEPPSGPRPGQPVVRASARSSLSSSAGGSGLRARALGHHIHRPMSRFRAVTSTDRTTMVSS